jgi:eukaryotic-like serine/threonine-protein kinase
MEGTDDELLAGARARVGRVLKDKWHLDKLLGLGGMAAVYEATHRNRSRVAVKMLHPSLSLDREVKQRFLREGYVANSVDHPGVVRVLDDDVDDDGTAFLVLDLLEGETLDARWAQAGGRLPVDEVVPLMARILDVLSAAHAKGIVHRDVKPENIFLTSRGEVRLLDFGIARLRETSSSEQAALTRSGATMGTPVFMAPEQARGRWEQVDECTDVWALGAMMFTLLSGHWVHEAETWNETLILAAIRPARSLSEVVPEAPPALVTVVDRALAFEKSERWASALAMQAALQALSPADLVPLRAEYLRTQPVLNALGKGADPLSATAPAWPSILDSQPLSGVARPAFGSAAGGTGPVSSRTGPISGRTGPISGRTGPVSLPALAPSPTVVPATLRTSADDEAPPSFRKRSRFPTWLVLLAAAGGGVYWFKPELAQHLDVWSARSASSVASGQGDGDGVIAGKPDVAAGKPDVVAGKPDVEPREAIPPAGSPFEAAPTAPAADPTAPAVAPAVVSAPARPDVAPPESSAMVASVPVPPHASAQPPKQAAPAVLKPPPPPTKKASAPSKAHPPKARPKAQPKHR